MKDTLESPNLPPMSLKCPQCYKGTTSLKRYGVIHYVLFLGIAARWRAGSYTACPKCVRKKMLKDTLSPLNILSANLMWLLAILPYNIGVMLASFIPGHSRKVVDLIQEKFGISVKGGEEGDVKRDEKETPPVDPESVRQEAIEKVLALKRENAPRSSDPYYRSYTGYNYGAWADKGFSTALGLLRTTQPKAGEAGPAYLERVKDLIRAQRDEYRASEADEDGACSGALDAAIWAIAEVSQEPGPKREGASTEAEKEPPKRSFSVPVEEIEWQVWHEDVFDRECPPNVETSGRGLVGGLTELWRRFLSEQIHAGGKKTFSRFYMSWEGGSAIVSGDWDGATRLREWIIETKAPDQKGHDKEGDPGLLRKIAQVHVDLILSDKKSDEILAAAAASENREEFATRLSGLSGR